MVSPELMKSFARGPNGNRRIKIRMLTMIVDCHCHIFTDRILENTKARPDMVKELKLNVGNCVSTARSGGPGGIRGGKWRRCVRVAPDGPT